MHIFLDKNILSVDLNVVLRVGEFCDSLLPEEYFCCKLGGGVNYLMWLLLHASEYLLTFCCSCGW